MSEIKKILKENAEHLSLSLESQFVQIPSGSCSCHKPIVFINNRKTYKCDRCGEKYKLVVEIVKIKKG